MYRLKLLGGAAVESDEGPVEGRGVQRRRVALLALLSLSREHAMPRERIAAVLWPDADGERARHLVSDSIYRINQAFAAQAVIAAGDELRLDVELLPVDAVDFVDAIVAQDWERATALYRGPFLDGFFIPDAPEFERWVDAERDRLARDYMRALEAQANEAERTGHRAQAVDFWRRVAVQDPHSSRIALRLMYALDAAGERTAAIKHARIHAELVRQEVGASPDAEVLALAERWRVSDSRTAKETLEMPAIPAANIVTELPVEPSAPPPAPGRKDGPPLMRTSPVTSAPGSIPEAAVYTPLGLVPDPSGSSNGEPPRRRSRRRRWPRALGLAILLAAVIAAVVQAVRIWRSSSSARDEPRGTIAVLPFVNLSGDAVDEYMSDGITDELINTLADVPGLRVASRTSAFSLKGTRLDVREIGKRLGVDVVLEGSVRRSADRLRVAAQLVGAGDGYQIWSQTFDRGAGDVLGIQTEIASAILDNLRGRLGVGRAALPAIDHPRNDPEAYDLYLKGRFAWHQRTETGLRGAVRYFTASVARAPRYARAWAGLADAYAVLGFYDYLAPREAFPKARNAADRAIALDSTYGAPYATRGYVSLYYDWKFPQAESEFRRAIELDPTYSTAHQWYGNFLASRGRFAEAEREMRRAEELDPLSLIANAALGWVWNYQGRFDEAIAQYRRTLDLNPTFHLAWLWMGLAQIEVGRPEDARTSLREAVRLSGGTTLTLAALAQAHAAAGSADSARAILSTVEARAAKGDLPSYDLAAAWLALGDRDQALAHLEHALENREHSLVLLRIDPRLKALRGDKRFEDIGLRVEGEGRR